MCTDDDVNKLGGGRPVVVTSFELHAGYIFCFNNRVPVSLYLRVS